MKPWVHAESSARTFGGKPEDYLEIHNFMDSSKAAIADVRHRALTHTSWFIGTVLEKIFGVVITNSAGDKVSVRDIGEQHVLEDFRGKFIPTPQDFFASMVIQPWMNNGKGGLPPSSKGMTQPRLCEDDEDEEAEDLEERVLPRRIPRTYFGPDMDSEPKVFD